MNGFSTDTPGLRKPEGSYILRPLPGPPVQGEDSMPTLPVFVFGDNELDGSENVKLIGEPLATVSATKLNSILREGSTVVLVDGRLATTEVVESLAAGEFARDEAHAGSALLHLPTSSVTLVPVGRSGDFKYLCGSLPISLAALAAAPESRCAVVLNTDMIRDCAEYFQNVDSPVREFIVRLSLSDPDNVTVMFQEEDPTNPLSATISPVHAVYPPLVPSEPPRSHDWLKAAISKLKPDHLRLADAPSESQWTEFRAGLWQMNDWLDLSHSC